MAADGKGAEGAKAFITGVSGPALTADEAAFLGDARPFGLILFARNCRSREQIADLCAAFREAVGRPDAPVLVDQEGGRVQRLEPPGWRAYPAAATFGALERAQPGRGREAARIAGRLIAHDLGEVGITVNCVPVLDVPQPGSDPVIGDRAYGKTPEAVIGLARAAVEGLAAGGVLWVAKHVPGHGRAGVDSHHALPRVDAPLAALEAVDFPPFRAFRDAPFAMTAHVVYRAIDPARPATVSPAVVGDVIRGTIGYDGALMTDDLSMKALGGPMAERAAAAIAAGCDLALHCNGDLAEMRAVAGAVPPLSGAAAARCEAALAARTPADAIDPAALAERLWTLTGGRDTPS